MSESEHTPPREGAAAAIEANDLRKTYPGDVQALAGVSLVVAGGSVFGLLGPNGAGKSTTVQVLTTLTRPDGGSASIAGIDVLSEPGRVRQVIGVVGQRIAVDGEATGRENLVLEGRLHGLRGGELRQRVEELLHRFRLDEAADRVARTYSGGMKRKLDVAMALVHRPRVLFLDEPTTGLDPEARAELWGEIGRLTREDGLTILLTTHYLEEADKLASRLAIVDRGRIVATGSPEEPTAALPGDAVLVALRDADPVGRATASLAGIDGLAEASLDGRLLRARAAHGAAAVPLVLSALDAAGVPVASVTVARPSLDDVYLRHTGRSYRPQTEEVPA
jgi:ABC-2 type transport system ATP-binding protein